MGKSATIDAGQEQHLQALEYANRVRLARAQMKRRIAAGELSAAEVILSCPWQAHSMSISDLLMSQKRWGRARCRRLLVSLGVGGVLMGPGLGLSNSVSGPPAHAPFGGSQTRPRGICICIAVSVL